MFKNLLIYVDDYVCYLVKMNYCFKLKFFKHHFTLIILRLVLVLILIKITIATK